MAMLTVRNPDDPIKVMMPIGGAIPARSHPRIAVNFSGAHK